MCFPFYVTVSERVRRAKLYNKLNYARIFISSLSSSATERLIHAFVSSKLDYCNSILLGLPSYELEKLQRLQNTAARLTVRAKKSAHITPVLKSLHWLPVKERIIFKILLVTYKILHGFAPACLNELLLNFTPHRLLRSSSLNLLSIPKTKTVTYGDRSFSVIAPKLWNDFPIIISVPQLTPLNRD